MLHSILINTISSTVYLHPGENIRQPFIDVNDISQFLLQLSLIRTWKMCLRYKLNLTVDRGETSVQFIGILLTCRLLATLLCEIADILQNCRHRLQVEQKLAHVKCRINATFFWRLLVWNVFHPMYTTRVIKHALSLMLAWTGRSLAIVDGKLRFIAHYSVTDYNIHSHIKKKWNVHHVCCWT